MMPAACWGRGKGCALVVDSGVSAYLSGVRSALVYVPVEGERGQQTASLCV